MRRPPGESWQEPQATRGPPAAPAAVQPAAGGHQRSGVRSNPSQEPHICPQAPQDACDCCSAPPPTTPPAHGWVPVVLLFLLLPPLTWAPTSRSRASLNSVPTRLRDSISSSGGASSPGSGPASASTKPAPGWVTWRHRESRSAKEVGGRVSQTADQSCTSWMAAASSLWTSRLRPWMCRMNSSRCSHCGGTRRGRRGSPRRLPPLRPKLDPALPSPAHLHRCPQQ